jgi:hypothetical protein
MAALTLNLLYVKMLKFSPKNESKNNILWRKLENIFELFWIILSFDMKSSIELVIQQTQVESWWKGETKWFCCRDIKMSKLQTIQFK